jgi:hypothetical protein
VARSNPTLCNSKILIEYELYFAFTVLLKGVHMTRFKFKPICAMEAGHYNRLGKKKLMMR